MPRIIMVFLAVNLHSIFSALKERERERDSDPQQCRKAGVPLAATRIWQPLGVMDRK